MTKLHTHKSSHCRSDLVDMIFGQSFLRNNFLSTDDKIYFTSNAKDEFYSDEIWIYFLLNYIVHRYFFPSKIPSEFSKKKFFWCTCINFFFLGGSNTMSIFTSGLFLLFSFFIWTFQVNAIYYIFILWKRCWFFSISIYNYLSPLYFSV